MYRPLRGPALTVQLLLAVFALVTLVAVASDWLEINLLSRLLHDPASVLEAEASASDSRQALLVPFLNLVRPKQIMDTIWRGSDPVQPGAGPFWSRAPVPALVHLWWAVFVLSWLVDRALVAVLRNGSSTVEALRAGSFATLVADGLDLLLALLCFELARRATRRQQSRAARLAVAPPA